MSYLGSWNINDYLTIPCNTHDPSDGSSSDADSVPTYRIYEDETGTAIANGSTAKLDDANTLGFYTERVQLLSATGFEAGKCYTVYLAATINSTAATANHTFQIRAPVDVQSLNNDTTALDNLEKDYDGTGYAKANSTIGTCSSVTAIAGTKNTLDDLNDVSTAEVNTQVDTALADINLDHLVKSAVDTDFGTTVHNNSVIGYVTSTSDTSTYARSTDALQSIVDNSATEATMWAYASRTLTAANNITSSGNALEVDANDYAKADVQSIAGDTTVPTTFKNSLGTMVSDTVQASPAPTTTAFAGSSALSSTDNFYNGRKIFFLTGSLADQAASITDYAGSTRVFTVSTLTAAPTATDTFMII